MKKKIAILIYFVMLVNFDLAAQANKKNIDFVLSIDEQVVVSSISNFKIIAVLQDSSEVIIQADYFPGNLSIAASDYDKLLADRVSTTYLFFNYTEHCGNRMRSYSYRINIGKGWLVHYFYVLEIYNTDKKENKHIYEPLDGENYTFEVVYPGGAVKRVTKKRRKNNCE